jgi:hypothetical protein
MQERAATAATISPVLGLLLLFVFSLHYVYLQAELNRVWDSSTSAVTPSAA